MLNNLKWKTLETRRFHTKATLMYKILNDLSAPQLSNSFIKLNDTNINYNLRNLETDLALPRPYTNFLKRSFKYSGAMLWNNLSYEALHLKDFLGYIFMKYYSLRRASINHISDSLVECLKIHLVRCLSF